MLADDVTKKLVAPVGIRSDALGVSAPFPDWAESNESPLCARHKDPLVADLRKRLATAPVITEWGGQPPDKTNPIDIYTKGLHDVVRYHVSMTSSVNFPDADSTTPMDPKLYLLWAQANIAAGYRYSVEARPGSQSMRTRWRNIRSPGPTTAPPPLPRSGCPATDWWISRVRWSGRCRRRST